MFPSFTHRLVTVSQKLHHLAVEICKYHPQGGMERTVAVKRLTSQAAVDIAQFASEANLLRKLVNE